jgi:hypothetical protein
MNRDLSIEAFRPFRCHGRSYEFYIERKAATKDEE